MAIKRKVPVTVEFESDTGIDEIKIKVLNFDKKKQKQLKKFGKNLDKEHSELNQESKELGKEVEKLEECKEELEVANLMVKAEGNQISKTTVKELVKARKAFKSQERKVQKLKEEYKKQEKNEDDIQEKIFRKQLELMVEDPTELFDYIDQNDIPLFMVISEIFKLMKEAQKNS